jgi:hypothetical protein
VAIAAWVSIAPTASAYPVHRRLFQEAYGATTSCQLCHGYDGNTERNLYGEAWHARGETLDAFRVLEALDSDGDGATNRAEIEGGSNPGDPDSTLESPGARWQESKDHLFIPLEQLELVFDQMSRVEAAEIALTDEQAAAVEAEIGEPLSIEDRLPTFYFNVIRDRRDQVAVFHHLRDRRGKYALLTAVARDGTAARVLIFRAPDEEGDLYFPYLRCLVGQPKDALPEPGEGDCPIVEGRQSVQHAVRVEVQKVLYIVAAQLAASAEQGADERATADAGAASESDGELRFEAVDADGEASLMPASTATVVVLLLIAFYLGSIALLATWIQKQPKSARWPSVGQMPAEVRVALVLVVLGLMLAQLVAIIDAYVQTQVVHESTWSYFSHLSEARLLGTSHSHLFGYTITYGVLALLMSMTSQSARVRALVVVALLLTGPFDILSWWGQKLYSPRFDWLTMSTGAVAGSASLVAAVAIWRNAFRGRPAAADGGNDGARP